MRRLVPTAVALVVLFGLLTALTAAARPAATPSRWRTTATSQLDLRASLTFVTEPLTPCPPGSPDSLLCPTQTAQGPAPGLGMVSQTAPERLHMGQPLCSDGDLKVLGYPVRWVIGNKGELNFAASDATECFTPGAASVTHVQTFMVTSGSGIYEGASGSGTLTRVSQALGLQFRGSETWAGTLSVPGLDFDLTAPVLTGAANKTVKAKNGAKSVRVIYRVAANDDRDGALPVACKPQSGSRFRIGRTVVKCAATDSSANTASVSFTIAVKR